MYHQESSRPHCRQPSLGASGSQHVDQAAVVEWDAVVASSQRVPAFSQGWCCIPCCFTKCGSSSMGQILSVGAFSWADSVGVGRWQFCGSSGVLMGGGSMWVVVVFAVAHGGPVLVTFEARYVWSGRHSQRGARWEERPGFALVGVCQGSEVGGDGGGLLANMGLNRVGAHLKGPATVFLVLVGHSEGASPKLATITPELPLPPVATRLPPWMGPKLSFEFMCENAKSKRNLEERLENNTLLPVLLISVCVSPLARGDASGSITTKKSEIKLNRGAPAYRSPLSGQLPPDKESASKGPEARRSARPAGCQPFVTKSGVSVGRHKDFSTISIPNHCPRQLAIVSALTVCANLTNSFTCTHRSSSCPSYERTHFKPGNKPSKYRPIRKASRASQSSTTNAIPGYPQFRLKETSSSAAHEWEGGTGGGGRSSLARSSPTLLSGHR
ncbi:uncharacterized protein LACBIDRAFT_326697 [Laccaria bicolor S238N-H82]|uniref:Predicted protein n=1 Tax=Laccaria bicolor (strain S238N-H82 / ATCC MYA-4686) TaxID=486041 RepID=B0D866_LACBS|nr:uncharacterized protein LACBIDRAFT_326697 [Laccaria bicolor S238N-H82]EDR09254.1 predicted protein [Laccaria bicolor S238N-H82]|eukprot:XP_001880567.1 predicted protein [Laccaria bicolor S238N-H82]